MCFSSSNSDTSSESTSSSAKHRRISRQKSRESGKNVNTFKKRIRTRSPSPKQQYSPGKFLETLLKLNLWYGNSGNALSFKVSRKNVSSPKHYERRAVSPPPERRYDKGIVTPKRKIVSPRKMPTATMANKKRDRSSSSNSGSSESSGSESDSSYSSSSESSDESSSAKHVRSRDKILHERKIATKKGKLLVLRQVFKLPFLK